MFDWQNWVTTFRVWYTTNGYAYNDAVNYGVEIELHPNAPWKVIGIHKLTGNENSGNHNVYVEVLCKQNAREGNKAIHWTWEGRRDDELADPVFGNQKPADELVNLPLHLGMVVSTWLLNGEKVTGLSSDHPDDSPGNTVGHHSFFVCFQEVDPSSGLPLPEPQEAVLLIKKSWLDQQEIDEDGFIIVREN